ncbi:MAG TPA: ATP-binding cassette domain-containing protein [Virgibacillus sp.]|nr:ATP-binding cassette domain-containing protein [Virgibacillus sp.]HLR68201.1 ATP-binding cassette domain-containing protein [Virgibacillus sp.]
MDVDEVIKCLPNGLNSRFQDSGTNLSSGQKQRLYLAKTLLSNPSNIILDEATNHLDAKTEESILEALTKIKNEQKLILIMINHNKNMWNYADETVELGEYRREKHTQKA